MNDENINDQRNDNHNEDCKDLRKFIINLTLNTIKLKCQEEEETRQENEMDNMSVEETVLKPTDLIALIPQCDFDWSVARKISCG